jgi:hypothetical protein
LRFFLLHEDFFFSSGIICPAQPEMDDPGRYGRCFLYVYLSLFPFFFSQGERETRGYSIVRIVLIVQLTAERLGCG